MSNFQADFQLLMGQEEGNLSLKFFKQKINL